LDQVVTFLFKYKASLFSKGEFGFAWHPSVILIVVACAGLGVLAYLLYAHRSVRLPSGSRVLLIAIRCALIALILFCVMRPVIVVPSVIPQASYVGVLIDDSRSMQLPDEAGRARIETARALMTEGSPFYTALSDKFKLRAFEFAAAAQRVPDAGQLAAEGEQTNLPAAIEQALRDMAGLPVSALVVISDGASNAEGDSSANLSNTLAGLRGRGLPVFTVGTGQTEIEGDLELVQATAPRRMLAGSAVTAELLLRSSSGSPSTVKIDIAEDSHALRSQTVPVTSNAQTVARVTFTPSSAGIHRYSFTAVAGADEPIRENNSQEILIEVADTQPRILYIEGEPRWEYGKLRGAMADEKNLVLVGVLRSADGKFYRQGIEKGEELASGFPKSEEELFRYEALIIGSVEATFFTFDQLRMIEQFVARRGGSLLALGGAKAFTAGGYTSTPMADLLPVVLSGQTSTETQNFKAAPTTRGRDHPAARLVEDPDANEKAWEQMPPITLPEVITELKPGATVLLEARSTQQKDRIAPLLIEQRYGRGRTLALAASDTWRWRMLLESKNKSFESFWRNMLRHMVESVRGRVEASTGRTFFDRGEEVQLRVEVADEKFNAVANAHVQAVVTTPGGRAVPLDLKPTVDGGFEGYSARFAPADDGVYNVELTARPTKSAGDQILGHAKTSFIVGSLNREARNAAQNREMLKRIAAETGGRYYTYDDAVDLIEDVAHTEGTNSVRETKDLWDMPINFMLAIALASAEWFIRKRRGLA
jgi:uncharacterized membrane protein